MDSNQLIQQVKKIIYKNNDSEFIELRYSFVFIYIYVVIYIYSRLSYISLVYA